VVQKLTSLQVSLLVRLLKCDMEWNGIGSDQVEFNEMK
jgi:hypothetical protein